MKRKILLACVLLLAGATAVEACGRLRERIAARRAARAGANSGGCSPGYSPPDMGDPFPESAKTKTVYYQQVCVNGRCYLVEVVK